MLKMTLNFGVGDSDGVDANYTPCLWDKGCFPRKKDPWKKSRRDTKEQTNQSPYSMSMMSSFRHALTAIFLDRLLLVKLGSHKPV